METRERDPPETVRIPRIAVQTVSAARTEPPLRGLFPRSAYCEACGKWFVVIAERAYEKWDPRLRRDFSGF